MSEEWEPTPCGHCRTVIRSFEGVGMVGYGAWCRDCSAVWSEIQREAVEGFSHGHDVDVVVTKRHHLR